MPARHNRTGRSSGGGPFVALYRWFLESPAWRSLSPAAKAAYLVLASKYNGANNGRLVLGQREAAAECRVSKVTAAKALRDLEDRRLVAKVEPGGFSRKTPHATTWRLEAYRDDVTGTPPTKAFMRWEPSKIKTRD